MVVVGGRRLKAEMLVKEPRPLVLGMNDQGTDADNVGGLNRAQQRILQEPGPESLPLPVAVHGQPGKQHDRDRKPGQSLGKTFWRIFVKYLTDSEAVEPDNPVPGERDIGRRSARQLVGEGMTVQKAVEAFLPAAENRCVVLAPELFDPQSRQSNTPRSRRSCFSRG